MSFENAEAETNSCESAVDMIAARTAEKKMPARMQSRMLFEKIVSIMTRKSFSGSSKEIPFFARKMCPSKPIAVAAPNEMKTHVMAIRRDPLTSAGFSIDMKRTRMWGMPK